MSEHPDRLSGKRILVCGGRDYTNRLTIEQALTWEIAVRGWDEEPVTIVHGDAPGADRLAAAVALDLDCAVEAHPADWELYGPGAGRMRNEEMALSGIDLCIAFAGGRGTDDMVRRARRHEIPTMEVDRI